MTTHACLECITVIWDGKDTAGVLFPKGTTVQVHVSGTTGFTPSSATLKGAITEPGGSLLVGGIAAGATFYVRFIAVFPDGELSDPSAEGSAMVGLVQGPEINGDAVITQIVAGTTPVTTYKLGSIWINTSNGTYNVLESVGGTPTWVKREWDTAAIAANAITANQIAAQAITAKLVSGEVIRTTTVDSGARVRITSADGVEVFGPSGRVFQASPTGTVTITGYQPAGSYLTATDVGSGGTTTIDGGRITTGTVSADRIDVTNLVARNFRSATSGPRVSIGTAILGNAALIDIGSGAADGGQILNNTITGGLTVSAYTKVLTLGGSRIDVENNLQCLVGLDVDGAFTTAPSSGGAGFRAASNGQVFSYGIDDNTTPNAANVRVGASAQLLKSTSTQRVKDDFAPLDGSLVNVDPEKLSADPASVNHYDVLDVTPTEFSSLCPVDIGEHFLGFVAEDVAAKFPWAAEWDSEGIPSSVSDRPILAALLQVVKDQQATIANLTARIEALES